MIARVRRVLRRKFVQDTLALQAGKLSSTVLGIASSVVIVRLMEPKSFGVWALALSLVSIWQLFNLTGIVPSTHTRLGLAIGQRDEDEILVLMAVYTRIMLAWALVSVVVLGIFGPPVARALYDGQSRIGVLAAILSLTIGTEGLYNLVVVTFQARRMMRTVAVLQNINLLVLALVNIGAIVISPTAEALVAARLLYTLITLVIAGTLYRRGRGQGMMTFPALRLVIARARSVAIGPYWRFGFSLALDKNLAALYTQLPLQLVGIFGGEAAAGFLQLALRWMTQLSLLTSAIFENMQAVVPQAVGRGDYLRLRKNFLRALALLTLGSGAFYAVAALLAPLIVPPIYGEEWRPAVPLITALSLFGVATAVGGVFGPLYRAFDMMRGVLLIKAGALIVVLLPGVLLLRDSGAIGGVWIINALFALSVAGTVALMLPALNRRAAEAEARIAEDKLTLEGRT